LNVRSLSTWLVCSVIFHLLTACATPSPALLSAPTVRALAAPLEAPPVRLRIRQAEIEMSSAELNRQFQSILALSNEKRIKNALLSTLSGGRLEARGQLDLSEYVPDIPFQITGSLSVRPGNQIRYEATDVRVAGIPVKRVLDVFGVELANIAKFKDRFGRIEQQGNAFHLIVEKFTPGAVIEGEMKRVSTAENSLTVFF
jgi:hypothetical protein